MKGKRTLILEVLLVLAPVLLTVGCSTSTRMIKLRRERPSAQLALPPENARPMAMRDSVPERDTLTVRNVDGKTVLLMRGIRDEQGEIVANQVLEAAKVTARFLNVAERHGKVDLEFQLIVPSSLQAGSWQLRYTPTLFVLGDSVRLDSVLITGKEYRRRQLRGYQQYQRFLDKISADSSRMLHIHSLENFLRRNIPELYALKTDSSYVSDEKLCSIFGVTEAEAVRHYTDDFVIWINRRRIAGKDRMFRKYVKAPLLRDGVRLDTVLMDSQGDYVYNYVQTISTRPRLRKAVIVLDGEIYEQDRKLMEIARSPELSFYISSVATFVDDSEKYVTRIIERRVEASASYNIHFKSGASVIDPALGDNAVQLGEIRSNLSSLMRNEEFCLDSICIVATASPEGSFRSNAQLSARRSESIAKYFRDYAASVADSIRAEAGVTFDVVDPLSAKVGGKGRMADKLSVKFITGHSGEDWEGLDRLVLEQQELGTSFVPQYEKLRKVEDPDSRERMMKSCSWYPGMFTRLYPKLRRVDFSFRMHRRGMVKDTVHTTTLDTLYMSGVQAIKDRDYDRALEILRPYNDYNAAVAYCAKDFNHSALAILEKCEATARVNYMLALLYARFGRDREAVEHYLLSCSQDGRFVHRGRLDPEIYALIRQYNL